MTAVTYCGTELELFEQARNWKTYWKSQIAPFVRGSVLEVGAGIGANTAALADLRFDHWVCLEPDPQLVERIRRPDGRYEVLTGVTADLPARPMFDAILYIDVLEHIEHDAAELARSASLLTPAGSLIVLSPAHNFLYTPFDRAIGHYRRYTRSSLLAVAPAGLREHTVRYLDSCGALASLGNRLLLHSAMPAEGQIRFWDQWLVPLSRWLDPLLFFRAGKSVLGVWTRNED
jgi:SAM-dependent methyltransferase